MVEFEMKEVMSVMQSGVNGQSCHDGKVSLVGRQSLSSFARPDSRGRLSLHVHLQRLPRLLSRSARRRTV